MGLFDEYFGLIPLLLGTGAILFWTGSAALQRRESPSVSHAIRGLSFLLFGSGWINFYFLRKGPYGGGEGPAFNVGLMVGLAIAVTAVRIGVRLEKKRIDAAGSGTPPGVMARRATLCFLVLSAAALVERLLGLTSPRAGWALVAVLCIVWIHAAIFWRFWPGAGPLLPVLSHASRATFFAMAVGGLVALFGPLLGRSALGAGVGVGAWLSAGVLVCVAWAGTALAPRTAVLVVSLTASLGGMLVLRSL